MQSKPGYKAKYEELEMVGRGTSSCVFLVRQLATTVLFVAKKIQTTALSTKDKAQAETEVIE